MYRWYQKSGICFAFLSDVPTTTPRPIKPTPYVTFAHKDDIFGSHRWFQRGWTLQELIAPKEVEIYDSNFQCIGRKSAMLSVLSWLTSIKSSVLQNEDLSNTPIATRMSQMVDRRTTRIEDEAYCLMGICDVNMPLLYGEGDRAFIRLQEDILKRSDDHSIFAWRAQVDSRNFYRGLLATSPQEFSPERCDLGLDGYGEIWLPSTRQSEENPITVTNLGVQICVPLIPLSGLRTKMRGSWLISSSVTHATECELIMKENWNEARNLFMAILDCGTPIGVLLIRLNANNQYARVDTDTIVWFSRMDVFRRKLETICLRQNIRLHHDHYSPRSHSFHVMYSILNGRDRLKRKLLAISPNPSAPAMRTLNNIVMGDVFEAQYLLDSLGGFDNISRILILRFEISQVVEDHINNSTKQSEKASKNIFTPGERFKKLPPPIPNRVESILMLWNPQTGRYSYEALHGDTIDYTNSSYDRIKGHLTVELVSLFEKTSSDPRVNKPASLLKKTSSVPEVNREVGALRGNMPAISLGISMRTRLLEHRPIIEVKFTELPHYGS